MRGFPYLLLVVVLTACAGVVSSQIPFTSVEDGRVAYDEVCIFCHAVPKQAAPGETPGFPDCASCDSKRRLFLVIRDRMPLGTPDECTGLCAGNTAEYIFRSLHTPAGLRYTLHNGFRYESRFFLNNTIKRQGSVLYRGASAPARRPQKPTIQALPDLGKIVQHMDIFSFFDVRKLLHCKTLPPPDSA